MPADPDQIRIAWDLTTGSLVGLHPDDKRFGPAEVHFPEADPADVTPYQARWATGPDGTKRMIIGPTLAEIRRALMEDPG